MSKAKLLIILLVVFLLGDLTYSFFEYYFTPLDGDISSGNVRQVLDDPFGFNLFSLLSMFKKFLFGFRDFLTRLLQSIFPARLLRFLYISWSFLCWLP